MMGHTGTVKLLIEVGQTNINAKSKVSHSDSITKHVIVPNYNQSSNSNYIIEG